MAWALEGLGKIREKEGDLAGALAAFKEAGDIRRALQSSDKARLRTRLLTRLTTPIPHTVT